MLMLKQFGNDLRKVLIGVTGLFSEKCCAEGKVGQGDQYFCCFSSLGLLLFDQSSWTVPADVLK